MNENSSSILVILHTRLKPYSPESPLGALFLCPKKCNKVQQQLQQQTKKPLLVAPLPATRKNVVALFNPSRCTPKKPTNPYKIKVFTTYCNNCNNCNNKYKKYLWSWRNRVYLQDYRVFKEKWCAVVAVVAPPTKKQKIPREAMMIRNDTHGRYTIAIRDRAGIGDAGEGGSEGNNKTARGGTRYDYEAMSSMQEDDALWTGIL